MLKYKLYLLYFLSNYTISENIIKTYFLFVVGIGNIVYLFNEHNSNTTNKEIEYQPLQIPQSNNNELVSNNNGSESNNNGSELSIKDSILQHINNEELKTQFKNKTDDEICTTLGSILLKLVQNNKNQEVHKGVLDLLNNLLITNTPIDKIIQNKSEGSLSSQLGDILLEFFDFNELVKNKNQEEFLDLLNFIIKSENKIIQNESEDSLSSQLGYILFELVKKNDTKIQQKVLELLTIIDTSDGSNEAIQALFKNQNGYSLKSFFNEIYNKFLEDCDKFSQQYKTTLNNLKQKLESVSNNNGSESNNNGSESNNNGSESNNNGSVSNNNGSGSNNNESQLLIIQNFILQYINNEEIKTQFTNKKDEEICTTLGSILLNLVQNNKKNQEVQEEVLKFLKNIMDKVNNQNQIYYEIIENQSEGSLSSQLGSILLNLVLNNKDIQEDIPEDIPEIQKGVFDLLNFIIKSENKIIQNESKGSLSSQLGDILLELAYQNQERVLDLLNNLLITNTPIDKIIQNKSEGSLSGKLGIILFWLIYNHNQKEILKEVLEFLINIMDKVNNQSNNQIIQNESKYSLSGKLGVILFLLVYHNDQKEVLKEILEFLINIMYKINNQSNNQIIQNEFEGSLSSRLGYILVWLVKNNQNQQEVLKEVLALLNKLLINTPIDKIIQNKSEGSLSGNLGSILFELVLNNQNQKEFLEFLINIIDNSDQSNKVIQALLNNQNTYSLKSYFNNICDKFSEQDKITEQDKTTLNNLKTKLGLNK